MCSCLNACLDLYVPVCECVCDLGCVNARYHVSAVPVPLSHQHLLSACLGLPRQRPRHTNGVKRPAAVLCPEAPEASLWTARTDPFVR